MHLAGDLPLALAQNVIDRGAYRSDAKRHGDAQPGSDSQRIERIEQIVETMAIEIERISEGQRFTTKLLADRTPDEIPMAHVRDAERVVTPH